MAARGTVVRRGVYHVLGGRRTGGLRREKSSMASSLALDDDDLAVQKVKLATMQTSLPMPPTGRHYDSKREAVDNFILKRMLANDFASRNFIEEVHQKNNDAIEVAAKLKHTLKVFRLQQLQHRVEEERRIQVAIALREVLETPTNEDVQVVSTKILDNVPRAKDVRLDKHNYVDYKLDLNQEQFPVASIERQYKGWFTNLVRAIELEKEKVEKGDRSLDSSSYGPILRGLPSELLATSALQEMVNYVFTNPAGIPFTSVVISIGRTIFEEWNTLYNQDSDAWSEIRWKLLEDTEELSSLDRQTRDKVKNPNWGSSLYAKIGSKLVELMCKTCFVAPDLKLANGKLTDDMFTTPAFYHTNAVRNNQKFGMILVHQGLALKFVNGASMDALAGFNAPHVRPMACPPEPWSKPYKGGYLTTRMPMVRATKGSTTALKLLSRMDCSEVMHGLTVLGKVPWVLNQEIFKTAKVVKDGDLGITGLPVKSGHTWDRISEALQAKKPKAMNAKHRASEEFRKASVEFRSKREKARRDLQERTSKHIDFSSKLDMADFVKDYEQFYFPYSLDFRGRAYPIPPVSHMGDDLARSMLKFKVGHRLGERGLYWLKVHMANQMGYDKASFAERVQWTEERLDKVFDSARSPIDNENPSHQKFWATADNPWQALATCMELFNAYERHEDPRDYVCHLPVHQDGSCNGLQHYAALGRDLDGGRQVNLVKGEKPGDVYTAVATQVKKTLLLDAENYDGSSPYDSGNFDLGRQRMTDEMKAYCAHRMKDSITRKLVKQTVMTSVYGVTYIGAREQIERRLEEMNEKNSLAMARGEEHGPVLSDDELFVVSNYLTKLTLQAIGTTFKSANEIQAWLGDLAKVSTDCEQPVSWITPLGLPVVQPYRSPAKRSVTTAMQLVILSEYSESSPIHKVKQRNAFPPNFVHSIDSTHMLMTARECDRRGIDFTAVHDSFWTHPSQTDEMNQILREQFVELHEHDLLHDLRQQFLLRFPQMGYRIPEPPMQNTLDIREVLDSPYFFS
mmetsp:Transcript_8771/g.15418  ORF Transcript_8771/g.15418 Transcript_8771/m.15418 type:complete len:1023 (+) Transcript_8771:278-3346(+)